MLTSLYQGVDSSCFDDAPEDVMYGMFYQATGTYVVKCASRQQHRVSLMC